MTITVGQDHTKSRDLKGGLRDLVPNAKKNGTYFQPVLRIKLGDYNIIAVGVDK